MGCGESKGKGVGAIDSRTNLKQKTGSGKPDIASNLDTKNP